MKVTTFTDMMVRKIKPTDKKQYRSEGNGFTIRVMPSGVKTWLYRYDFDGRRRELNLGVYPDVPLETARNKCDEARKQVKNGIDIAAVTAVVREERKQAPTVSEFAEDEYFKDIKHHPKYMLKTCDKVASVIKKEIITAIGRKKVIDVTPRDLLRITDKIVERNALVMANRVFAFASMLMNHAVEKRVLVANPFAGMKRPGGKEEPRERNLSESEIKTLWLEMDSPSLNITNEIKRAVKLVLVTAQRPGEVIGMHCDEIDGNWWIIPKERSKNGRAQRVFLTNKALSLIGSIEGKGYVFKTAGESDRPMTQLAMNYAIRRHLNWPVLHKDKPVFDEKGKQVTENRLGIDHFTPHDLRRTAATFISTLGFSDEVVDAVLNHKKQGIIKTYNQNKYDREKQQALEAWERKLDNIINCNECKVIPIGRKVT